MTRTRKWLLGSVAGLLLAIVGLQTVGARRVSENTTSTSGKRLAAVLPTALAGYAAHDEPIAATAEMKRAVGELLNFSDAVYRIYQAPGRRVTVYVAMWEAGRMLPRMVASHTPDVCWVGNGWCRDRAAELKLEASRSALARAGFVAGEARVFVAQSQPEYVVFWHLVGDQVLSYGAQAVPPWWAWLDEMQRCGLNLKQEQLFLRISSNVPLQEFLDDPATAPLREALLQLGFGAKTTLAQ